MIVNALNFAPCSGLKPANGYGKLEIALWSALAELGVSVNPVGHILEDGAELLSDAAKQQFDETIPRPQFSLVIGHPHLGADWHLRTTRKWLYTMSESTRVSEEWVELINRLYDGVIVPAPDLVEIYRTSGVQCPVHFVPMGINLPDRSIKRREFARDETVFLTYSLGEMRKGGELAHLVFRQMFGGNPRFKLWIKTPEKVAQWLWSCRSDQVQILSDRLSEREWYALLADVDCFVFPSRGEGFGLPPREATLADTPTIATQWLGLWDVDRWGLPIPVREMRPACFDGGANHPDALWAEPDLNALAVQMERVVTHPAEGRDQAYEGRRYLRQFTWRRMAEGIVEVMRDAL